MVLGRPSSMVMGDFTEMGVTSALSGDYGTVQVLWAGTRQLVRFTY